MCSSVLVYPVLKVGWDSLGHDPTSFHVDIIDSRLAIVLPFFSCFEATPLL